MDPRGAQTEKPGLPLPVVAAAVAAIVIATMLIAARGRLSTTLGDTDDAMRLVIVRALMSGENGWFHQHLLRLQPPRGLDMHWSRLLDGGIAGMMRLFRLVLPPERAEAATRLVWPLAWTLPAIWAALAMARRLGGKAAVLPAAGFLAVNILLYVQWWPGRIDHHNVQIALSLAALAGAVAGGLGGGLLAGAATGLGLAVGLEALPFLALAGVGVALRFLFDPQAQAGGARAYAATLFAATGAFYLAQTPPGRWGASVCDALAANLWCAVMVAGAGLLATTALTRTRSFAVRLAALAVTGGAAAAVYLALDPVCLHGPLAAVDPHLKPIWMDHITEMAPLVGKFWSKRSNFVVCTLVLSALGAASWLWLGMHKDRRTPGWLILGAALALAFATALGAERMASYANWYAVPLIAAALGDLTVRYARGSLIPTILITAAFSQPALIYALDAVPGWAKPADKAKGGDAAERCIETKAFARLAALPTGLVLGEIDLGPRILAQTPHSVVAAPYHRMAWGILAAHHALSAAPGEDERAARALGAAYVVTCPARVRQLNHTGLGPRSLQIRLDHGQPPAWLQRLSAPAEPLQVYRVQPPPGG
ncbi:hypothetical protein [Phenylobacterium sp.]|jgi:hypothetical protein|uniref:hypothetical protein n=1 Tax=Phenylobacterium sp. TaxID=1871053 RepID=UPI002F41F165